jgi:hypothetical protein
MKTFILFLVCFFVMAANCFCAIFRTTTYIKTVPSKMVFVSESTTTHVDPDANFAKQGGYSTMSAAQKKADEVIDGKLATAPPAPTAPPNMVCKNGVCTMRPTVFGNGMVTRYVEQRPTLAPPDPTPVRSTQTYSVVRNAPVRSVCQRVVSAPFKLFANRPRLFGRRCQ